MTRPRKPHPAQIFRERLRGQHDLPAAPSLPGFQPSYGGVLRLWAEYLDRDSEAWPSQETLAQESGYSLATVERAFSWAVEVGLLVQMSKGYRGRTSVYRAPLPSYAQAATEAGDGASDRPSEGGAIDGNAPQGVPGLPLTGRDQLALPSEGKNELEAAWSEVTQKALLLEEAAQTYGRDLSLAADLRVEVQGYTRPPSLLVAQSYSRRISRAWERVTRPDLQEAS